jgi:hypothetical protein
MKVKVERHAVSSAEDAVRYARARVKAQAGVDL